MVIVYRLDTGDIVATIDDARKYPGTPPSGCGVLVEEKELGASVLRCKVDVAKRTVRPKTPEEIESEKAIASHATPRQYPRLVTQEEISKLEARIRELETELKKRAQS